MKSQGVEVEVKPQKFLGRKFSFCCLILTPWDFMKLKALSFNHAFSYGFCKGKLVYECGVKKRFCRFLDRPAFDAGGGAESH